MDSDQTSLELLSHFDRPKLLSPLEGVQQLLQPPAAPGAEASAAIEYSQSSPARDVRWILKWAAALVVIAVAASQLIAFAHVCQAERELDMAARAGASESIFPRATYDSISAAVKRRLIGYPPLGTHLQLTVLQNGRPVGQHFRAGEDDRISITLSAPASAFTPGWLAKVPQWRGDVLLSARAERTTPSHRLRPEQSQTAAE